MNPGDQSAFPIIVNLAMDPRVEQGGLTKRELFVMAAMQGLLSAVYSSKEMLNEFTQAKHTQGADLAGRNYLSGCEAISRNAVSYADALLAELAKGAGRE